MFLIKPLPMSNMTESPATTPIPVQLSEPEFIAFIFPHLSMPRRGPRCKLGYHCVFNLILWVLYTGMQWKCLPVPRTRDGKAGIHYTTIYRVFFAKWSEDGSLEQAFIASVKHLAMHGHLDLRVLHGDGTNTVAKKGGDGIGYSGHKHQKGEKILAIIDNNGFVLAPVPVVPVNESDTVLLPEGLNALKRWARLTNLKINGSYLNLDGGLFNAAIHSLRLRVERTFAWEDKFKRLLLRFEFIQQRHYGMKLMGYTLINLRHFCGA
jgi:transposase